MHVKAKVFLKGGSFFGERTHAHAIHEPVGEIPENV
jgi:hypothetical protein